MKKKIIFIVVSVLLMLFATIFMAVRVYNSSFKTFSSSGYVLNTNKESSNTETVKYYFEDETAYRSNYQENVEFKDINGKEVTVPVASFVHYNDESIGLLKKGVIFNLDEIGSKVPKYYNIFEETVLENINGTYFVDNLGKQLKFKNFIVKISDAKYMIVSSDIKLKLGDKEVTANSYVEIDFIEGNVVRLSNQEVTYQTIVTDASVLIGDNLALNLDSKCFLYKGEEIINLESIIIDSDDNIEIRPSENNDSTEDDDNNSNNATSDNNSNNNNNSVIIDNGSVGGIGAGNNIIDFGTNEEEVNEDNVVLPTGKLDSLDVSSNKIEANVTIDDPDSLIVGKTLTIITENSTGDVVYTKESDAGVYNIDVYLETLNPETTYNITTTATYTKKGVDHTIDLVNQVFITESLGITLEKYYYTDSELVFEMIVDDYSRVRSADVSLYTSDSKKIGQYTFNAGGNNIISFSELDSNTKYTVVVDNILYDNYVISDSHVIEFSAKTLKKRPFIYSPKFTVDNRNSVFKIGLEGVEDSDFGIEGYRYNIYSVDSESGVIKLVTTIDKESNNEFDLKVDNSTIFRNASYIFDVVVDFYDNEKYVEYKTGFSAAMNMSGKESPTLKWEKDTVTFERATGTIHIHDPEGTIDLNSNINIEYTDSYGVSNTKTANGLLNIPFDVNYLKSNEKYTVNVSARVSLDGKNYIDNSFVGSFIIETESPDSFSVNFEADNSTVTSAFLVKTQITNFKDNDTSLEASTLSELTFNLYEGKDINGTKAKSITKADADLREYYSDLALNYYNNEFILDPTFFGMKNSDFTSEYYTIEITGAYDYTRNIIPIENNVYTVRTNGTVPDLPTNLDDSVNYTVIRNKDAGDHYDEDLDPNTIVGIKVKAIYDNSKKYLREINYRVFDASTGVEIKLDEDLTKDSIKSDGEIHEMTFWLENGTDYSTVDTEMRRGHKYYFTWDGLVDLNHDGEGETSYPLQEDIILKSQTINVEKQAAKIVTYPSVSTNNTLTLKYRYSDIDNTLYDKNMYAYISNDPTKLGNLVDTQTISNTSSYNTVTFSNLTQGYLTVSTKEALLKTDTSISDTTYVHQYFENSYTLSDLSYTVMKDVNRIQISINDYQENLNKINRIAALKLTFTCDGESIVKDFVEIKNGLAVVDMIDLNKFIGKDVTVSVEAYYDSGIIGYDLDSDYCAFQSIINEYGGGEYYKINTSNDLINSVQVMGSIYSKEMTNSKITLTNMISNKKVSLDNNPGVDGFQYNYQTMLLKELKMFELTGDNTTFSFDKIIPGVSLRDDNNNLEIVPGIRTVSLRGDIYGAGASEIKDNKVYVELYSTDEQGFNLNEVDTYEFTMDQLKGSIELDNLLPKQDYAIRIGAYISDGNGGYDYSLLYDVDENSSSMTYYFKTLSSVAITNISYIYEANAYDDKNIVLQYNLDRVIGYDKIEYVLYKSNDFGEWVEMDTKITASTMFDDTMQVKIPCNPGSEFEFNKQYRVVITPVVYVSINNEQKRIELDHPGDYTFTLSKLRSPHIGVSSTITPDSKNDSLDFRVTILDVDKVIVNQTYRINVTDVNGNIVTPDQYVDKDFNISDVNKKFVIPDLESGMTYKFNVIYNVDIENNIVSTIEKTATYISNALNEEAVYLGDVYATANSENPNKVNLSFYNSYKLITVDKIRYTIYNADNGLSFDNEMDFLPVSKQTIDNTQYYLFTLLDEINTNGIYYIQVQFISENNPVAETTLEYSYTNAANNR